MTSRERVHRTLQFDNPERVPRQLWTLPWALNNHKEQVDRLRKDFPDDITMVQGFLHRKPATRGDPFEIGEYTDEWGCKFTNVHRGIIGEIKEPLLKGEDWEDRDALILPEEMLAVDTGKVNSFCSETELFVIAGACPRPFERLQFLRGTEQLFVDLMQRPAGMFSVMNKVHDYYCRELEVWAQTDVDALMIMDDWGSQNSLLINPELWVEIFKPLYADYLHIAHGHGKKMFMHSDGYILQILPHLVELGLDAINSQIFCMGLEQLKQFKGKITFWGEMDRQHLLPDGTAEDIHDAVKKVKDALYDQGGCIAQCEFGPGGNPDNVRAVFEAWDRNPA